jgi:hypothetical protein
LQLDSECVRDRIDEQQPAGQREWLRLDRVDAHEEDRLRLTFPASW